MADVTVTSAVQATDGSVTITGTNFTQTTTTVLVDGVDTPFTYVSATELTVDAAADAVEITVSKNGVDATAQITDEGAEEATSADPTTDPGTEAPPAGDPQSGQGTETAYQPATIEAGTGPEPGASTGTNYGDPVDPTLSGGGAQHGIAGAGDTTVFTTLAGDQVYQAFVPSGMVDAPKAITPGTWPNPIDTFRQTVAGVPLVGLIPVGDEKTPYPTGASLGAGKKFWQQTGYYKSATPT